MLDWLVKLMQFHFTRGENMATGAIGVTMPDRFQRVTKAQPMRFRHTNITF